MPIEPTNVSNPMIREVEPSSPNLGSWTSMQGSSTGGKDRPLNSIWEKAINGAQKLFGSDSSDTATLEDKSESDKHSDESARRANSDSPADAWTGFSGRRFGSFGGSAFGGNTFGSVSTSRAEPRASESMPQHAGTSDFQPKDKQAQPYPDRSVEPPKEKLVPIKDSQEQEETSNGEIQEAGTARSSSKGLTTQGSTPAAAMPPPVAPVVASGESQSPTPVAHQTAPPTAQAQQAAAPVTAQAQPQVSTPAQQQVSAPIQSPVTAQSQQNTNTAAPADAAKTLASGVPQVAGEATKQVASAPSMEATQVKSSASTVSAVTPAVAPTTEQKTGETAQAKEGAIAPVVNIAKKGDTPLSSPTAEVQTAQAKVAEEDSSLKTVANAKNGLGFDVAKAKEGISEGLNQVASKATPAPSTTAPTTSGVASQGATRPAPTTETTGGIRMPETGVADAKDTLTADASKRDFAVAGQQRVATSKASGDAASQARSGAAATENVVAETKSGENAAGTQASNASANQFSREAAAAAATRVQNPAAAVKPNGTAAQTTTSVGLNAVSGGQSLATGPTTQGAQQGSSQQQQGGDTAAKQDFGTALKQASTSKGGEKLADGAQSFDAKVAEATSGRRAEAANKSSQTSYVSKTAAEVKEVVATLTKSIDRLVTDKAGTMNFKINFEGGGSVNLRLSMDNGQVNTQMLTDVVGLESAIKANWNEIANDWNQKGVKLNTPQFQNSEGSKDSSFDNLNDFASKQDRQAEGRGSDSRGRSASQAARSRGFAGSEGEASGAETPARTSSDEVVSDKELKTYA